MRWLRKPLIWQRKFAFLTHYCWACGVAFRWEYYWRKYYFSYTGADHYSQVDYCEYHGKKLRAQVCEYHAGKLSGHEDLVQWK